MHRTRNILGVIVAVSAMAFFAGSARAATILQSGATVGGWTITIPAGIALVDDGVNGNTLDLEKFAAFPSTARLNITFTETAGATSFIDITNENVTNLSGSDWSGFQFFVNGGPQDTVSNSPTFSASFAAPNGGASGVTFTSKTLVDSDQVNYMGTQVNGSTAIWGFGSDGDLIIDANPTLAADGFAQIITFGEQPTSGGGGGTTSVPLPAASWLSLCGLALVVVAASRKRRDVASI